MYKQIRRTVFLFGEAEKGEFCTPSYCHNLTQLVDTFGNPPEESLGIMYAVQTLLYERGLIFFRVKEEGFSTQDYLRGLNLLQHKNNSFENIAALCLPGVGDIEILNATSPVCNLYKSFLILNEKDLYDYLMY